MRNASKLDTRHAPINSVAGDVSIKLLHLFPTYLPQNIINRKSKVIQNRHKFINNSLIIYLFITSLIMTKDTHAYHIVTPDICWNWCRC